MPIKKVGDKWEVNGQEFDTEEKAEIAYKAMIALKFDAPVEDKKSKKKKSKKPKKDEDEEE